MSEQAKMSEQESPQAQTTGEGGSSAQQQQQRMRTPEHGGGRGGRRRRHGERQPQQQQQNQPRRPEASLNMEELRDLVELIAEHGFTDFELEREGFRVRLRRDLAPQIIASTPNVTFSAQSAEAAGGAHTAPQTASATHSKAQGASHGGPPHPGAQAEAAAATDEDLHIIKSPIVGTFYRAASPTSEPFVRIGTRVEADTVVCIIEAMKLMNEIQAETSGEVAKIYVENGQPVEYGQPLFGIKK